MQLRMITTIIIIRIIVSRIKIIRTKLIFIIFTYYV
jgi:hypothetical protein